MLKLVNIFFLFANAHKYNTIQYNKFINISQIGIFKVNLQSSEET